MTQATTTEPRLPRLFVLFVWFGLLTGFGEVVALALKRLWLDQFIRFGPHIAWMAPTADAVLFLIAGSILYSIARRCPRLVSPRALFGVLAFLSFLSLLLHYYPFHFLAKALLAAGLATQSARLSARWPEGVERVVNRSARWMVALVVLLAIGVWTLPGISKRQRMPQAPSPSEAVPNVLLIVLDTVRAKSLSVYGYGRPTTPHLEQWAQAGTVFEHAVSTSPWTLPAHGSMFTGRWPNELSANWETALDGAHATLAEVFRRRGYLTGGFVANTHYGGYEFGLARGFSHYEDYVVSPQEFMISSSIGRSLAGNGALGRAVGYYDHLTRRNAESITDSVLNWIGRSPGRPFFAFVNYFDSHESYLPPPPFNERFGRDLPRGQRNIIKDLRRTLREDWYKRPEIEIKIEIDMYDGTLAYQDLQLDRLFRELEARGVLHNTIVIVTADHGEQFGEHGLFLHSTSLYESVLHVPLMILYSARVPAALRVGSRVSLRDLPATVVDLARADEPRTFPGRSLARYWSGEPRTSGPSGDMAFSEVRYAPWAQERYPVAKGDMQSLMDDDDHYIRHANGTEELYALGTDPLEQRDLGRSPASRQTLEKFRAALRNLIK